MYKPALNISDVRVVDSDDVSGSCSSNSHCSNSRNLVVAIVVISIAGSCMVRFMCIFRHKPAHGHGHGGKAGKQKMVRTKAQKRLVLFWVVLVCVCPMGVLYGHMGTIQPQAAYMASYWPA